MGPLNNFDPIFFYLKLRKSAIGKAFDGVVTPSGGEAVRLRLLGVNYQEIKQRLGVSTSFIAPSQRNYKERGLAGIKLGYKVSKTYLTYEEKAEIIIGLDPRARRNISELERHLIETYEVVFWSRESYYQLLRSSHLTWQKGNR
jgi:transposase